MSMRSSTGKRTLKFRDIYQERLLFPVKKIMQHLKRRKVGFPLWRNFYVRKHVNLKGVNEIEAMKEESRVEVKLNEF